MKLEITKFGELFNIETNNVENIIVINKEIIITVSSEDIKKLISLMSSSSSNIETEKIQTTSNEIPSTNIKQYSEEENDFYVEQTKSSSSNEIFDDEDFLQG